MKKNIFAMLLLSVFITPAMADTADISLKDKAVAEQKVAQDAITEAKTTVKNEADEAKDKTDAKHKEMKGKMDSKANKLKNK